MKLSLLTAVIAIAALLVACDPSTPRRAPAPEPPQTASAPLPEPEPAPVAKPLPPDGTPLYDFLLAEIPDLIERVPCSCCRFRLAECYRGACPKTCGPCNEIGRHVYKWHTEGMSDDDIIARVKKQFPRKQ